MTGCEGLRRLVPVKAYVCVRARMRVAPNRSIPSQAFAVCLNPQFLRHSRGYARSAQPSQAFESLRTCPMGRMTRRLDTAASVRRVDLRRALTWPYVRCPSGTAASVQHNVAVTWDIWHRCSTRRGGYQYSYSIGTPEPPKAHAQIFFLGS
jgi:hypothetical protein